MTLQKAPTTARHLNPNTKGAAMAGKLTKAQRERNRRMVDSLRVLSDGSPLRRPTRLDRALRWAALRVAGGLWAAAAFLDALAGRAALDDGGGHGE